MREKGGKDYSVSLGLIAGLAALLYFIRCSLEFPFDPDLFVMIKWGEALCKGGILNVHYPYSWVPDSCRVPWVDYEWLCHVVLYFIYSAAGLTGPIIYKTIIYGLSYLTLFIYARKTYGQMPAVLALLIAVYLGRWFLSPRPMSYTAAFFPVLTMLLISLQSRSPGWRDFVIFPLLFIIWENFHGGFFVGLVFMAAALIVLTALAFMKTSDRKEAAGKAGRLLALFALSVVMTLFCNPYGPNLLVYVLDFFISRPVFMQSASDMASPFGRVAFNAHYFVIASVTTILLAVFYLRGRKRPTPVEILAYFFWLACSLRAVRNMQLFSTAAIPVIAYVIAEIGALLQHNGIYRMMESLSLKRRLIADSLKVALLTVILIWASLFLGSADLSGRSQVKAMFPTSLRDFLLGNSLPPKLFNHDILGDYFVFCLYPKYLVSFDSGWNNIYTDRYFIEIHQAFHNRDAFYSFVNRYDLDTIIIQYKYYGDFIASDPAWELIFEGEGCRVFLRNCPRTREIIESFRSDRLSYPDTFETNAFLYRCHLQMKNYQAARKYLQRLIVEKPDEKELREHLMMLDRMLDRKAPETEKQTR
jgi:hypothetical protein